MDPLPTISKAYSLVLQEKNQREVGHSSVVPEATALNVIKVYDKFSGKNYKQQKRPATPVAK